MPIQARVIKDYTASDPDPLIISVGEELKVGENDTTWPAFVRCWNKEGNGGWVPERFIERNGDAGVALVEYTAAELTAVTGETIFLEKEVGGWYWATNEKDQIGWVPAEYVEYMNQ